MTIPIFGTNHCRGHKNGGLIIRLVCGLFGLVGIWALVNGLVSWLKDSSAYPSIWNASVGDVPYCHCRVALLFFA